MTELTPEQLEARKKYLENTIFLRIPKDQIEKFGIKVGKEDSNKDIAHKVLDKFDVSYGQRGSTISAEIVKKMEQQIKTAGLKLPNKSAVTKSGKKINYLMRLKQLMGKVAVINLQKEQE